MWKWPVTFKRRRNHQHQRKVSVVSFSKGGTSGLAQIDRYLWRILEVSRRVYWHVDTFPFNPGWTSRPDINRPKRCQPWVPNAMTYKVSTASRWTKVRDLERSEIKNIPAMNTIEAAQREWASPVILCTEDIWNFEILCWLKRAQRCKYFWFISIIKNECVSRLPRRSSSLFNYRCDSRLLEDWNGHTCTWQNSNTFSTWVIPVY